MHAEVGPAAVGRITINIQIMPLTDLHEKITADFIEGHLPVVILAGLFTRIRQLDAQSFKCLFLLGLGMAVTIIRIKDMTFMDMRSAFTHVQ